MDQLLASREPPGDKMKQKSLTKNVFVGSSVVKIFTFLDLHFVETLFTMFNVYKLMFIYKQTKLIRIVKMKIIFFLQIFEVVIVM